LGTAVLRAAAFRRPAVFPAAFRAVFTRRLGVARFWADARDPRRLVAPLVKEVCFCRFVERFRVERAALRFAAFLAIVIDPRSVIRRDAVSRVTGGFGAR